MNLQQKKAKIVKALSNGPLDANEVKSATGLSAADIRSTVQDMLDNKEVVAVSGKRIQLPAKEKKIPAPKASTSKKSVSRPVKEKEGYTDEELDEFADEFEKLDGIKRNAAQNNRYKKLEGILIEAGMLEADEEELEEEEVAEEEEVEEGFSEEDLDDMQEEYEALLAKPKLIPRKKERLTELEEILLENGRLEEEVEEEEVAEEEEEGYTDEELDEFADEFEKLDGIKRNAAQNNRYKKLEGILIEAGMLEADEEELEEEEVAEEEEDFGFGFDEEEDEDEHGDDEEEDEPIKTPKKPSSPKAKAGNFKMSYVPIDQLEQKELEIRIVSAIEVAEDMQDDDGFISETLMRQVARYRRQLRKRFNVEL